MCIDNLIILLLNFIYFPCQIFVTGGSLDDCRTALEISKSCGMHISIQLLIIYRN